jgi:hypothetical protein
MTYADMNNDGSQGDNDTNKSRSSFKDRALILLFLTSASVAMVGWLWLIGRLSGTFLAWAVNRLT